MKTASILVVLSLSCAIAGGQNARTIDPEKSVLTVHVFKSGLFSAFGHEHEISAPIQQGSVNQDNRAVDFTVDARKLRVMDPDVSDKDRNEIQQTMLGPKVLDSEDFPEIRFRSTNVEPQGDSRWLVHGDLTIRGETRAIKVEVHGENGHYEGSAEIRQKDFGITPVTVAGGAVKVKDELRIDFNISLK